MNAIPGGAEGRRGDGRPAARQQVGEQVSRVDGPLKVRVPRASPPRSRCRGWLYAALVPSTIAEGTDRRHRYGSGGGLARRRAGDDARECAPDEGAADDDQAPRQRRGGHGERAVMQDDRVHWNGQTVAVVLAETQEQADHAARLIEVAYAAEPASLDFEAAKAEAKPPENILGEPAAITVGDAEAALRSARQRVDADLSHPAPQPLRHRAERGDGRVGGRRPPDRARRDAALHFTQATLADLFGLERGQVQ